MSTRAVVVARGGTCAILRATYRCALPINRVVEAWDQWRQVWQPEIRLCHLHAIEYLTGEPVMVPSIAQQELITTQLGA